MGFNAPEAAHRGGRARWAQVAEWLMAADCKSAAPWSYGGSNPPLCTSSLGFAVSGRADVGMVFEGVRRKVVALAALAVLAAAAWGALDAGRIRTVVFVLLGGFALRIALTPGLSRYDEEKQG